MVSDETNSIAAAHQTDHSSSLTPYTLVYVYMKLQKSKGRYQKCNYRELFRPNLALSVQCSTATSTEDPRHHARLGQAKVLHMYM